MSKLGKKINEQLHATSPLMTFLNKVADFILLGLFTVLFCIPVVTIGAAFTAMFYVSFRLHRGVGGGIVKPFISSFKSNFKQATILWVITLVALGVIAIDVYFYLSLAASAALFGMFLFAAFLITSIIVIIETLYVYPYVAKFKCTNMQAIRSSSFLGLKHLPITILLVVVDALLVAGCIFVPILFLLLPGAIAFIHGLLIHNIFLKYIPKTVDVEEPHEEESEENEDEESADEEIDDNMKDVL